MPASSWRPYATGALADDARAAIAAIGETLAAGSIADADAAGVALFWAYHPGDEERRAAAVEALYAAIEAQDVLSLHGGLVGSAWALAHVGDGVDDALAQVDELLVDDPPLVHDLIDGLAGLVVYWLERPRTRARDEGLARLVARLENTREGATWRTPPEHLAPETRARFPGGVLDCGLAHGAPGVVAALSRLDERVVDPALAARARSLAAEATRWVLAQQLSAGMPPIAGVDEPARTAWCYGDPGVAIGLARTARADAEALARHTIARDPEQTGVAEPTVCHGAAGLAHVMARWGQGGDRAFGDAARGWLARALAYPRPEAPGLLEGAAGLGLVLLAAISDEEPAWDRVLACDSPAG